ncbi:MAG: PQQ-binding-like beta-propeller repeat protein [Bacteroidota bacterium]
MKHSLVLLFPLLLLFSACSQSGETSDWRGPGRDGIYPESGLLRQWPDKGPDLLWSFEGLGFGHNAVAVANNMVYVTGMKDSVQSTGTLYAFGLNGELLWEKEYGKDFTNNFIGTRSTPVVVDDLIYIESGMGTVYCLKAADGEEVWSKNFIEDFGVDSVIQFGYAESVLIDGDQLICIPGGEENNVVALDRFSGDKVWASKGHGEQATYNSPILIEMGTQRLVIAMTTASIMGIDADNGEMYWRIEQTQRNNIHANTPLFYDGKVLVSSADPTNSSGLVLIELLNEGKDAQVVWRNTKFRNLMGGLVRIDSLVYGSAYLKKDWQGINWNTGETQVQNKEFGGGSIIYADGMFYCYSDREGEVALVDAGPDHFEVISKFKVPLGTNEHWARLVIDHGVLYVRHGDALMAYNIEAS